MFYLLLYKISLFQVINSTERSSDLKQQHIILLLCKLIKQIFAYNLPEHKTCIIKLYSFYMTYLTLKVLCLMFNNIIVGIVGTS